VAGELLPRAGETFGVRYKLATYSLNTANEIGAPKARGFALILDRVVRVRTAWELAEPGDPPRLVSAYQKP
jgi:hypothetical protein